jgi:crotonobetainyl-CoA:carnitine CoA-transferase CaiB-like acyl-CoA transferase
MAGVFETVLEGIRVLDLTEERGLYAGKLLADFGADVIKVEPPTGCEARQMVPFKDDIPNPEGSLYFISLNSNKRSITLNLRSPAGRPIFNQLVQRADVLVEDFEPPVRESLGLDYPAIRNLNQRIIVASISGFGQTGPYSRYKAPDIVSFAMGGLMYISGAPDKPPVVAPCEQAYRSTSIIAVFGILTALYQRLSTNEGQFVDASAHETMATMNEEVIMRYSLACEIKGRYGSQHTSAPARIYPCKDGYVHLVVLRPYHWRSLVDVLDNPEVLMDEVWYDPRFRRLNVDMIDPLITEFTMKYTRAEITQLLQAKGLPCTPVNTPADFAEDVHIKERDFITEFEHPAIGRHRDLGVPFKLSEMANQQQRPAPLLGQHNEEIYCDELGHPLTELARFKDEGTI